MAVPVSYSLGGGAEHAHCPFIRNQSFGPNGMSNQCARGSGHNVYARWWCSPLPAQRDGVTESWHAWRDWPIVPQLALKLIPFAL